LNYIEALREQTACVRRRDRRGRRLCAHAGPGVASHPQLRGAPGRGSRGAHRAACDDRVLRARTGTGSRSCCATPTTSPSSARPAKRIGLVDLLAPPEMVVEKPLAGEAGSARFRAARGYRRNGWRTFSVVAAEAWMTYGIPSSVTSESFQARTSTRAPHRGRRLLRARQSPAAAGSVLLSHGIGGIYWVSTVSTARGKGLPKRARGGSRTARSRSARAAVSLQASPMGHPIYRRMGFTELATYRLSRSAAGRHADLRVSLTAKFGILWKALRLQSSRPIMVRSTPEQASCPRHGLALP
jgi:hypothetical protein